MPGAVLYTNHPRHDCRGSPGVPMRQTVPLLALLLAASVASADEKLKGIACRSVHLGYTVEAGTAFYVEATVKESADGTYFCAAGFNSGYFGIQQLGNGKK